MKIRTMIERMKKKGLSQNQIAEGIGYSSQYVSDIVTGVRGVRPSYALVQAVTKFYKAQK
jgi:transcriptional regulator with XRE-family HTH domain